jgi:sulfate permease, SulP family
MILAWLAGARSRAGVCDGVTPSLTPLLRRVWGQGDIKRCRKSNSSCPARSPSCWSAMQRRSVERRPRQCRRRRYRPEPELIAHGPANILSGLFGGFLVVGSLSKTSVVMAAGARTQLANLVAAVFCFLSLMLLTPLFRSMPHPALAAIVIAAMLYLSKPGYLRDVLARTRWEFALAAIDAGELMLVPHGIVLGVALSLVMLIYRTSHPEGAVVGQLPGTEAYHDVRRHPEALTFPSLLIWRVGGDLFFASAGHLHERLKAAVAAAHPPAKHVLLDADSVNFTDTSGCDAR